MPELTELQYLKKHLTLPEESSMDFIKMWRDLSDEDKADLKAAARAEMDA